MSPSTDSVSQGPSLLPPFTAYSGKQSQEAYSRIFSFLNAVVPRYSPKGYLNYVNRLFIELKEKRATLSLMHNILG